MLWCICSGSNNRDHDNEQRRKIQMHTDTDRQVDQQILWQEGGRDRKKRTRKEQSSTHNYNNKKGQITARPGLREKGWPVHNLKKKT